MRRRKAKPESIAEVIETVFKKLEKGKKASRAQTAWRQAAGKEISGHSRVVAIKKNTLVVAIRDSAWFYQANLKKEAILNALRKKKDFENITKISFRIGSK